MDIDRQAGLIVKNNNTQQQQQKTGVEAKAMVNEWLVIKTSERESGVD